MSVVNVRVENRRGFEQMLKSFRRACMDSGLIQELKKREYYQKPSEKRRQKEIQRERERAKELSLKNPKNKQKAKKKQSEKSTQG